MELDHRWRRHDGVYRWFRVRVHPRFDENGEIVRWYGLLTDIEDQRQAEEALRQSEQHLRLLVETLPAVVWRATAGGAIDYANQRLGQFIGRAQALRHRRRVDFRASSERVVKQLKNGDSLATQGLSYDTTFRLAMRTANTAGFR